MRREENWAIDPVRIHHFFQEQPDVEETQDGFWFGQCHIRLIPFSGQLLGIWQQKRTIVIMEGPDEDTAQIYKRFFLRFLSAGG